MAEEMCWLDPLVVWGGGVPGVQPAAGLPLKTCTKAQIQLGWDLCIISHQLPSEKEALAREGVIIRDKLLQTTEEV